MAFASGKKVEKYRFTIYNLAISKTKLMVITMRKLNTVHLAIVVTTMVQLRTF